MQPNESNDKQGGATDAPEENMWEDHFLRDGLPDSSKWAYETNIWRNHEAQEYTAHDRSTARVEEGKLILQAHQAPTERRSHPGTFADYRSASLYSKASWHYGRVEVRARLPRGRGLWPAIWMMPEARTGKWPECGEIDIMEYVGWAPHTVHASVHTAAYNHMLDTHKTGTIEVEDPWDTFHTYALQWDARQMTFMVDDQTYFSYSDQSDGARTWPFGKPYRLKINLAIGGTWGGKEGIDANAFPACMEIDSVRVRA